MELINPQQVPNFNYDEPLKGKIAIYTNCLFDMRMYNEYLLATRVVSKGLIKDGKVNDLKRVNVIFTSEGEFTCLEPDKDCLGYHCNLIIYAMDRIKKFESKEMRVFIFLEELVHHFWGIENETEVKLKNVELMKTIFPDFSLDIVKGWGVNGL